MKLKALITALVLGSSTLAMAAPAYAKRPAAPAYYPKPATVQYRPTVLAQNLALTKNTKRTQVAVSSPRRFSKLEIRAVTGQSLVDTVVITFANGERQVLRDLDRRLVRNQSMTIDLDGNARQIKAIAIGGESLERYQGRRPSPSSVRITAV